VTTESKCWYEYAPSELHKGVACEVKRIRDQQREQRQDMAHFMALYAAGNVTGLGHGTEPPVTRLQQYMHMGACGTRFNMASAIVDTADSMVAQSPAVPVILTRSGDYGLMRKARKKTQVLQGQMTELGTKVVKRAFKDAAKVGTGFVHGYIDEDGLPKLERVPTLEILIEHHDGLYGDPRSMHRSRLVSRELLKSQYPQHADAIDKESGPSTDAMVDMFLRLDAGVGYGTSGFVEVIESHHLATRKKGKVQKNGVHCITIRGATLLHEKTTDTEHWYEPVRYRERDLGYYGSGLVESCRSAQNRVNELIARVERGQDLGSNMVLLNPYMPGSPPVPPAKLTNEIGLVVNYDVNAGPPTVAKWDGTQWDLQEQIDLEFQRQLLVEGLSQEQTNGEGAGKGLTSGVAVRAQDDVQTRRLVNPIQLFQDACIGVAKLIERLNDKLAEQDESYEVAARVQQGRQTFLATSMWRDLAIPKGHAQVTMMPMSALPTTPQGRWAAVMEWIEAGFVNQQYAMQLLQFPDLDSYVDTELAHIDMAQWQVEKLLEAEDVFPDPRQLLPTAIDIATKSRLKARTMDAPPEVIDAFERFLVRCEQMIEAAALAAEAKAKQQQAQAAAQQPPMPGQGAPMPGPQAMPRGPGPAPQQLVQQVPMRPPVGQVVAA
jgi:hypothetical protein